MKPTVIAIVAFFSALVIGVGGMQFYHRPGPVEETQLQVPQQPKAHAALVDRAEPTKSIPTDHILPQTGTKALEDSSRSIPAVNVNAVDTNRLEAVSIKQKLMKRDGNYEYWAWRVEVKNNTDEILKVYLEIEWLDEDGFRVDYANEVRKIEPGTHPISKVEIMELDEAAKAKTVRVVELRELGH